MKAKTTYALWIIFFCSPICFITFASEKKETVSLTYGNHKVNVLKTSIQKLKTLKKTIKWENLKENPSETIKLDLFFQTLQQENEEIEQPIRQFNKLTNLVQNNMEPANLTNEQLLQQITLCSFFGAPEKLEKDLVNVLAQRIETTPALAKDFFRKKNITGVKTSQKNWETLFFHLLDQNMQAGKKIIQALDTTKAKTKRTASLTAMIKLFAHKKQTSQTEELIKHIPQSFLDNELKTVLQAGNFLLNHVQPLCGKTIEKRNISQYAKPKENTFLFLLESDRILVLDALTGTHKTFDAAPFANAKTRCCGGFLSFLLCPLNTCRDPFNKKNYSYFCSGCHGCDVQATNCQIHLFPENENYFVLWGHSIFKKQVEVLLWDFETRKIKKKISIQKEKGKKIENVFFLSKKNIIFSEQSASGKTELHVFDTESEKKIDSVVLDYTLEIVPVNKHVIKIEPCSQEEEEEEEETKFYDIQQGIFVKEPEDKFSTSIRPIKGYNEPRKTIYQDNEKSFFLFSSKKLIEYGKYGQVRAVPYTRLVEQEGNPVEQLSAKQKFLLLSKLLCGIPQQINSSQLPEQVKSGVSRLAAKQDLHNHNSRDISQLIRDLQETPELMIKALNQKSESVDTQTIVEFF